MQRESQGTTFRDIHGSKEAWFASIEDIITRAQVKENTEKSLNIRFLQPKSPAEFEAGNCVDFIITKPQESEGIHYITVSYCWAQAPDPYALDIPQYRIWASEDDTSWRPPRCPPSVFHRAIRFAARVKCPNVWIDQECIDQSDTEDIERHLQIMHKIYSMSSITVAPLSTDPFSQHHYENDLRGTFTGKVTADSAFALGKIWADKWFTRAWTFHERRCATTLILCVPTKRDTWPPDPREHPDNANCDAGVGFPVDRDLCLDMRFLQYFQRSAMDLYPGLFETYVRGTLFVYLWTFMEENAQQSVDHVRHILMDMEQSENTVIADRLAIFANACDMPWRLQSTRLNRSDMSYYTCLFTLVWMNYFPLQQDRQKWYSESKVLGKWFDGTLEDALANWLELGDH